MALKKSALATNLFAKPKVIANPGQNGQVRLYGESLTLTSDEDSGDVILMFPIPSSLVVRSVLFSSDGGGAAGAVDIGLYTVDENGANEVAVDADLFASAQATSSAAERVDVIDEAGSITLDERFKAIWEAAAQTADPGAVYWVALTVTTDIDADTLVAVEVLGVQ